MTQIWFEPGTTCTGKVGGRQHAALLGAKSPNPDLLEDNLLVDKRCSEFMVLMDLYLN